MKTTLFNAWQVVYCLVVSFINHLFTALSRKTFLSVVVPVIFAGLALQAQCLPVPVEPVCAPPGSIALLNNAVVGVGQTYTLSGVAAYTNLTMNGGTLIVCGNLTVTNLVFNSGTLIIKPGAAFNINMALALVMGANSNIINYGQFNTTSSIVTGSNNVIHNCLPGSIFNVAFNQIVIQGPNTSFVNRGTVTSGFFIVQSNNSPNVICSGPGSVINTSTFINSYPNAFSSPAGPSCIFINSQVINSQAVSNSSNVSVCYMAASVSIIGSPNWGSASVNSNCSSCSVALPVELLDFSANCDAPGQSIHIEWSTASELNNDYFEIQKSTDAIQWMPVNKTEGSGTSNSLHQYSFTDPDIYQEHYYYRLRQVDYDGNYKLYDPVSVSCHLSPGTFYVYPNPAVNEVNIVFPGELKEEAQLEIYDIWGRKIKEQAIGINTLRTLQMDVAAFSSGCYIINLTTHTSRYTTRLIVNK